MNEYDEYDNKEYSYTGSYRFLQQQLKSNQHAEKNSSLPWHQTKQSLPCSYQTLNYSANDSWKPPKLGILRHLRYHRKKRYQKKYNSSKFKQRQLFGILFPSFRGFIAKQ